MLLEVGRKENAREGRRDVAHLRFAQPTGEKYELTGILWSGGEPKATRKISAASRRMMRDLESRLKR